ncbi:MAG: hypothetical protein Q9170_006779 [Blastenia crenularia]
MKVSSSTTAKPSGLSGMFDNKRSTPKDNKPKPPPNPKDDDGFVTVSRAKPCTIEKPTLRNVNGRHSPPSNAADSRRSVYHPPTKTTSHYKESVLPLADRDPALLEIEANKGQKYYKSEYRAGQVIRGIVHEQDYMATSTGANLTNTDRTRTDSRYGPICTKYRKMIVLALFEDHYQAIPLFTHNGNGLTNKTRPEEFVSVRDHRNPVRVPPLSENPVLETEIVNRTIAFFDLKSTAHVTYVLSRKYDLPVVMEGQLTKQSLNRLIHLVNYYAPKQIKDASGRVLM